MTKRQSAINGFLAAVGIVMVGAGCVQKTRPHAMPAFGPPPLQTAVALDKDGNHILAGSFTGRVIITGGELASAGGRDIFVAKTDKAGVPVFPAQRFGGKDDDAATGVAVDADGTIVVTGTFQGRASFGAKTLDAKVARPEQRAVFVARLDPKGTVEWVRQVAVSNVPAQISVAIGADHSIVVGSTSEATEKVGESLVLTKISMAGEQSQPTIPLSLMSGPFGCSHALCQADWSSPPLEAGCGMYGCTATICLSYIDPYCCTVHWDPICVGEMTTVCQRRCDCSDICTQGLPFYPDACDLARRVINTDSSCGYSWGAQCVSLAKSYGAGCP